MLILQNAYRGVFFLFLLRCVSVCAYSGNCSQSFDCLNIGAEANKNKVINQNIARKTCLDNEFKTKINKKNKTLSYFLYIEDFIASFIEVPTSDVAIDSSTTSSTYLAGRAPIYNVLNEKVGTCSASFLCMQNADGIYTDISNYLSVDNGLIVSWFTPTKLINLELDSIIHSMVTECIVVASTKIGFNPFYGRTFNMIVSSDDEKIYFKLKAYKQKKS